jgi:hypothetical protein
VSEEVKVGLDSTILVQSGVWDKSVQHQVALARCGESVSRDYFRGAAQTSAYDRGLTNL